LEDFSVTTPADKHIHSLIEQIDRQKLRAMQRYFEGGSQQDYIEGQRAIGAERALRQLTTRLHANDADAPTWTRSLCNATDDLDLRPCARGDGAGIPDVAARFRRRGGRA
jgi:hypothetical protein